MKTMAAEKFQSLSPQLDVRYVSECCIPELG